MQPDIHDLNKAYHRAKLKRLGITFLQATTEHMWLMCLTRIAEIDAKNAPKGEPAPERPERYGD